MCFPCRKNKQNCLHNNVCLVGLELNYIYLIIGDRFMTACFGQSFLSLTVSGLAKWQTATTRQGLTRLPRKGAEAWPARCGGDLRSPRKPAGPAFRQPRSSPESPAAAPKTQENWVKTTFRTAPPTKWVFRNCPARCCFDLNGPRMWAPHKKIARKGGCEPWKATATPIG